MISSLTWIDLTATDRDKVRRVLDLFKEQGTVDELGLGSLRDVFSNALFPGTSVEKPGHAEENQQKTRTDTVCKTPAITISHSWHHSFALIVNFSLVPAVWGWFSSHPTPIH